MTQNLLEAACNEEWEKVRRLVEEGENVNGVEGGWTHTALHWAVIFRNADMCSFLLSRGANVNQADTDGHTPLHTAADWQQANICQLLVDHKADVTSVNTKGETPLLIALSTQRFPWLAHDSPSVCRPLITNESVNVADHHGTRPLHIAGRKGFVQTVQLLVDCGADVNELNEDGQTPLHTAAGGEKDCPELCSILMKHDAKIDAVDKDGNQPLHLACKQWHTATVRLLLSHGADVTALNKQQRKPSHMANESVLKSYEVHNSNHALHIAVEEGHIQTVQLLVDCGADVNELNEDGQTPLHTAAGGEKDCPELCSILMKHDAKIDAVDKDGNQPLHLACKQWHTATVRLLLSHGADVTALNKQQRKPSHMANESVLKSYEVHNSNHALHIAVEEGHIQTVQLLVDCGADVNELNEDGQTPLHTAAGGEKDSPELCSILMKHDAKIDAVDKDGNQPLHLACKQWHTATVRVLLSHGADVTALNKQQRKPSHMANESVLKSYEVHNSNHALHIAVEEGHIQTVQLLVDCGADVNVLNEYGQTPLHTAAGGERDCPELCSILLEHNAKVDTVDKDGNQPLHLACKRRHTATVHVLLSHGADVTALNKWQRKPLHLANESVLKSYRVHNGNHAVHTVVEKGHIQTVQLLVDCGADVNKLNEYGQTPLHTAAGGEKDCPELCSMLLDHNAKVDAVDKDGNQPLHLACKQWHTSTVGLLLSHGADLTALNNQQKKPFHFANESVLKSYEVHDGNHALHIAAKRGHIQTVQSLVDCGADVNELNEDGQTPLHTVAGGLEDCPELCSILLKHHAKIDVVDKDGNQPLHLACEADLTSTVQYLLDCNADVFSKNNFHQTVLHRAVRSKRDCFEVCEMLIAKGSRLNVVDSNGDTPLHLACQKGHMKTFDVLVKSDADCNMLNVFGETLLHLACKSRVERVELCGKLISHGVNPHIADREGNLALHVALKNRLAKTFCYLFQKSGDAVLDDLQKVNIDKEELMAIVSSAHEDGDIDTCRHIFKASATLDPSSRLCLREANCHTTTGYSLIQRAVEEQDITFCQHLIDHGASVNSDVPYSSQGRTLKEPPLHLAVELGHFDLCRLLVEHGATINPKIMGTKGALDLAVVSEQNDIVRLLLSHGADMSKNRSSKESVLKRLEIQKKDKMASIIQASGE